VLSEDRTLRWRDLTGDSSPEVEIPSLANRPGFFNKGVNESIAWFFLFVVFILNEAEADFFWKYDATLKLGVFVGARFGNCPPHKKVARGISGYYELVTSGS